MEYSWIGFFGLASLASLASVIICDFNIFNAIFNAMMEPRSGDIKWLLQHIHPCVSSSLLAQRCVKNHR